MDSVPILKANKIASSTNENSYSIVNNIINKSSKNADLDILINSTKMNKENNQSIVKFNCKIDTKYDNYVDNKRIRFKNPLIEYVNVESYKKENSLMYYKRYKDDNKYDYMKKCRCIIF